MTIVVAVAVPMMLQVTYTNLVAKVTAGVVMVMVATRKTKSAKDQRSHSDESGETKLHGVI